MSSVTSDSTICSHFAGIPDNTTCINQYFQKIYGKKYDLGHNANNSKDIIDSAFKTTRSRMPLIQKSNTQDFKFKTMPLTKWRIQSIRNIENIIHHNKKISSYGETEKHDLSSKMMRTLSCLKMIKLKEQLSAEHKKKVVSLANLPQISRDFSKKREQVSLTEKKGIIPQIINIVTNTLKSIKNSEKDITNLSNKLNVMKSDILQYQDHYDNDKLEAKARKAKRLQQKALAEASQSQSNKKSKGGFEGVLLMRSLSRVEKESPKMLNTMYMFVNQKETYTKEMQREMRRKSNRDKDNSNKLKASTYVNSPMRFIEKNSKILEMASNEVYVSKLEEEDANESKEKSKCVDVMVGAPKIRNASLNQTSTFITAKKKRHIH